MVSAKLADGRRYLAGDRFGAADLTFAALAGPALLPPGYGGRRFIAPPLPKQLEPQIRAWRATPAGRHALRTVPRSPVSADEADRQRVAVLLAAARRDGRDDDEDDPADEQHHEQRDQQEADEHEQQDERHDPPGRPCRA